MAATSVATYVIGAAVVGLTAYQADQQRQTRYDAKTAQNNLQDAQAEAQQSAQDKLTQQQNSQKANAQRDASMTKQQQTMSQNAGAGGFGGTVLTGPLGVPNQSGQAPGKTLLGS